MLSAVAVLVAGAVLAAGAGWWTLRAYRKNGGGEHSARRALAACGALAALALGLYLVIGKPELADAPFDDRLAQLQQRDPRTFTLEEALAVLAQAGRENVGDPLPHFFSGQVLLEAGRGEEAARSFDAALRRDPTNAGALLGLGRALVQIEGRVTPEALAAFQQAAQLTDDPAPWLYQAMAAMEEGRDADARRLWGEALTRMGPEDPRRTMAERMASGAVEN